MDYIDKILENRRKIDEEYCNGNIERLEERESLVQDLLSKEKSKSERRKLYKALRNLRDEKKKYGDMKQY